MIKRIGAASTALLLVLFGALALASPAQAAEWHHPDAGWAALDSGVDPSEESSIIDESTIELKLTEDSINDKASLGTSVETTMLGLEIPNDTTISFQHQTLDGEGCGTNNLRMFVIINGVNTNSWDQLQPSGEQCGNDGLVTFNVADGGTIELAGLVLDNAPPDPGTARVSNVTVNGVSVLFTAPALCEWDESLLASDEECVEPTPDPDPTPTPTPAPEESDEETLPVTGSSSTLLVAGGLLVGLGILAVVATALWRRYAVAATTRIR